MAPKNLTASQLKRAWYRQDVVCITAIEHHVAFVYAKGEADGVLVDSKGQMRLFESDHLAWKFIDVLKGNEPDPY